MLPVIQTHTFEGQPGEFLDAVGFSGGNDIIIRLVLLEHQPHGLDIFPGVSPVSFGTQVAKLQLFFHSQFDFHRMRRYFAGHKFKSAPGRLMIEQDAAAGKDIVAFPVISCQIKPRHL